MIPFLIAPLINVSMGVIEFLLRDLISCKQEKPLLLKIRSGHLNENRNSLFRYASVFWHI